MDFSQIVVLAEGPQSGYEYLLVDTTTGAIDRVGSVYEGFGPPAPVRRFTYRASDGLEIPSYLTLPLGRPAHGLPLVVLPHGGPAARETGDFDWLAQALAWRGYAVLQPNFRGSTVSGTHLAAGFGQLGRKMQTDLSDGVRALARDGTIDPARVCIVGLSYGGYAALAGVTLDPGVYRCAVSIAGVSDLERMRQWSHKRDHHGAARRFWDDFLGVSGSADSATRALSPVHHAAEVTVPVLLVHGRDDTVVPYEQSERMASALQAAGKPVTFMPLNGEDHWLSQSGTRSATLQHVLAFLAANDPPEPQATAAR